MNRSDHTKLATFKNHKQWILLQLSLCMMQLPFKLKVFLNMRVQSKRKKSTEQLKTNYRYHCGVTTEAKKRNIRHMAISKYALLKKEVSSLINSVKSEGTWLADEHIDHAQALLAKQFKEIGGLPISVCF